MKISKILIVALFISLTADCQNNSAIDNQLLSQQDSIIKGFAKKYFQDSLTVGLSIGIIRNNQLFTYHYGSTSKSKQNLPTSNTIYEIGSITKTFTGYLLAKAVLDKKLSLDDDIRKYLYGNHPNLEYAGHPIKVVHLANHTARLPDFSPNITEQKPKFLNDNPLKYFTKKMLLEGLDSVQIDTLPGTIREYSSLGIALLGCIIENVYHQSYQSLVEKYITNPLAMQSTYLSVSKKVRKKIPDCYNGEGIKTSQWDVNVYNPAGGIKSTITDMLKYSKLYFNKNDEAVKLAQKITIGTIKDGTGLTWGINATKNGSPYYYHLGGTGGFTSAIVIFPTLNSGFIILANSDRGKTRNKLVSDLATFLMKNNE